MSRGWAKASACRLQVSLSCAVLCQIVSPIFPVRYRTEYKLLLLTFKALHHLAPSYLTDLLQLYHPTRTLRSSSDSLLTARCARLRNYGDRAFCVAAPKLWKDLPLNIHECGSVHSFKRLLKTYFFKRAFNI